MFDSSFSMANADRCYNAAMSSYSKWDAEPKTKRSALRMLKFLARKGHADSQYICAQLYAIGNDVRKSEWKRRYWLEKAAKQGHAEAQYELGSLLVLHESTETSGFDWIKKAAEQGNEEALAHLAFCYSWGVGVECNEERSVEIYKRLAETNNPDGLYGLGVAYQYGNGVKKDQAEAERLYRLAIDQGDERAFVQLDRMLHPREEADVTDETMDLDAGDIDKLYVVNHTDKKRIMCDVFALIVSLICFVLAGMLFRQNAAYFDSSIGESYSILHGFSHKWPAFVMILGFGASIFAFIDAMNCLSLRSHYYVAKRFVIQTYRRLIPLCLCIALFQMPFFSRICLGIEEDASQIRYIWGVGVKYSEMYVRYLVVNVFSIIILCSIIALNSNINDDRLIRMEWYAFQLLSVYSSVHMIWLNMRMQPWLICVYIVACILQAGMIILGYAWTKRKYEQ